MDRRNIDAGETVEGWILLEELNIPKEAELRFHVRDVQGRVSVRRIERLSDGGTTQLNELRPLGEWKDFSDFPHIPYSETELDWMMKGP
jgi:hypothetical protein